MVSSADRAASHYRMMTETPVPKLVGRLAVPAIVSMLVTNIYNLVDTAFVGRLGTSASGAVGIVFGFMSVLQAFGFMYGQGAGSILARALGQQDIPRASRHATLGFLGSFFTGALISVLGFVFLDPVVYALGSTPTIAPFAKTYIFYILLSAPFMCASLTLNNLLRYEGKAALGMIGLMAGAFLNMGGDPVFMFVFGLGIDGAGLSTAISQIVSFVILLGMFLAGKTSSKIALSYLKNPEDGGRDREIGRTRSPRETKEADDPAADRNPACSNPAAFGEICFTGLPSLLRQGLNSISTVILNLCCAPFGDAAVAAMSIVSRIVFFAVSMALGVGQGFQPVAAFSYGAGKFGRLRKAYRFTVLLSLVIIAAAAAILCIFAKPLVGIFRDDPEVIRIGVRALRLQAAGQIAMAVCMPTEMLFQSTGQKFFASLISVLRNGLIFIPLLLLLSALRGLSGIQEAQPLSMIIAVPVTIPFLLLFFSRIPGEDIRPAEFDPDTVPSRRSVL